MVRISLAAARAPGEAGLSAGSCCCCAAAGATLSADPNAKPSDRLKARPKESLTAGQIFERHFIPTLLDDGLPPFNHTNSMRACQHGGARNADEQPMLNDARYRGQQCGEARRVGYSFQMGIDDPVAAVGDKNVTALCLFETQHH